MHTIGIDEAGRGALAGPVVVAAVAVPNGFKYDRRALPKLKDSKKLSARQRGLWYEYLRGHPEIYIATARVYQKGIDRMNIARSANLAASRSFARLVSEAGELGEVLLDGSLYLGAPEHQGVEAKTIIKGDEKRVPIKLASIVAKVTRDRYLRTLDGRYPRYGLAMHKGYGTKGHFNAIKKYGVLDIHRLTYLSGYPNLKLEK